MGGQVGLPAAVLRAGEETGDATVERSWAFSHVPQSFTGTFSRCARSYSPFSCSPHQQRDHTHKEGRQEYVDVWVQFALSG